MWQIVPDGCITQMETTKLIEGVHRLVILAVRKDEVQIFSDNKWIGLTILLDDNMKISHPYSDYNSFDNKSGIIERALSGELTGMYNDNWKVYAFNDLPQMLKYLSNYVYDVMQILESEKDNNER